MEWLKEMLNTEIDEHLRTATNNHIFALGSKSNEETIAFEKSADMVGRELIAVIDGKISGENAYIGRTYMDAPGIDGSIFINTYEELMSGDIVKVRVTGSYEYDLIGEIL